MQNLILAQLTTYSTALVTILTAVIGIGVAYLIFRFGWKKINTDLGTPDYTISEHFSGSRRSIRTPVWNADGTSNWLGTKWSAWDKLTYSPWKGYNRLRSRRWNMSHMN